MCSFTVSLTSCQPDLPASDKAGGNFYLFFLNKQFIMVLFNVKAKGFGKKYDDKIQVFRGYLGRKQSLLDSLLKHDHVIAVVVLNHFKNLT